MRRQHPPTDPSSDRGLSVAVTHVLAIGVTTILITVLLVGASSALDLETDRSTDRSLETVGERLAGEIANADAIGSNLEDGDDYVTLISDQPRSVAGSGYTVALIEADECDDQPLLTDGSDCLQLTASGGNVEVFVPLKIDAEIGDSDSAAGGLIAIEYEYVEGDDDQITIENRN